MQRSHALVLDIDGTLIDDCPTPLRFDLWRDVDWDYLTPGGHAIKKRPGVDAFLDAAFASGPVALWTHAGQRWASIIVNDVLVNADGNPRPWAFVWDGRRATPVWRRGSKKKGSCSWGEGDSDWASDCYCHQSNLKRLGKVWKNKRLRGQGFTPARTLIVDDTPKNCQDNYGNAIYAPTYDAANDASTGVADDVLPRLTCFLSHLARTAPFDVRPPDKRSWDQQTYPPPRPCCCYTCLRRVDGGHDRYAACLPAGSRPFTSDHSRLICVTDGDAGSGSLVTLDH
jgi:hypothetical protein